MSKILYKYISDRVAEKTDCPIKYGQLLFEETNKFLQEMKDDGLTETVVILEDMISFQEHMAAF